MSLVPLAKNALALGLKLPNGRQAITYTVSDSEPVDGTLVTIPNAFPFERRHFASPSLSTNPKLLKAAEGLRSYFGPSQRSPSGC